MRDMCRLIKLIWYGRAFSILIVTLYATTVSIFYPYCAVPTHYDEHNIHRIHQLVPHVTWSCVDKLYVIYSI